MKEAPRAVAWFVGCLRPGCCGRWTGLYCTVKRRVVVVLVKRSASSGMAFLKAEESKRLLVTGFQETFQAPAES